MYMIHLSLSLTHILYIYKYLYAQLRQLDVFCKVSRPKEPCIQQVANIELQKTTDVWVSLQAHYRMP